MVRLRDIPHYSGPTANPYRDADVYYAEQDMLTEWSIEHSHTCSICGEKTYEIDPNAWYEIDDPVCADCAKAYKFAKLLPKSGKYKCSACGYETNADFEMDFFEYDGAVLCEDCIEEMVEESKMDYDYLTDMEIEERYGDRF